MPRYGRSVSEWAELEAAGWDFLISQAGLHRTTSYTQMKHRHRNIAPESM